MNLRSNNIRKLGEREFDVLILGGGINGAVTASALTTQGASVALIDRGDFAGFTSQESSNLVWGGIKYMETLEFGLVRKLCTGRNNLTRAYPSNVREIRFFTSIVRGFRFHPLFIFLGTILYWFIGNFFTKPPRYLSRNRIKAEEPVVNTSGVSGGFEYSDSYLIDNDARFVFKFVRAAMDHGGIVANYVEATATRRTGDAWEVEARDRISGQNFQIKARVIVNACGPFADGINSLSSVKTRHRHLFSKGVHLIVEAVTPARRVLTFFADDGRLFFVIPMGRRSCIGTTDTRVEELPATVTTEDRHFIIDNINKRLKLAKPLTEADIIAERCGVRPLVVSKRGKKGDAGAEWTALSRKHEIEVERDRKAVTIFGGKLTDCLNVGDEVTEIVESLGIDLPFSGKRWYGEPPREIKEEFFHQARLMQLDELTEEVASEPISERLWRRYGSRALAMLEDIRLDPRNGEVLIRGTEYLRTELYHAARHEMVTRLEDFLRRRSKIALIERAETIQAAPGLREACVILFGDEADEKIREYFEEVADHSPAVAS